MPPAASTISAPSVVASGQGNSPPLANDADEGKIIQGQTPEQKDAPRNPARKVALIVLAFFALIMLFHVLTDQFAPSSSTGSVAAATTLVSPRVAGEIAEIFVTDNQSVVKGEPLFAIDPRPFDLAVRQAEASLASALQTVAASSASLDALRAKVAQAESNLATTQASADRAQALFNEGLSSQAAFDTVKSQLVAAMTALDAARADLLSNEVRLGSEEDDNPQIATARVQLEQAELNRQFATVRAPADGVITNLRLSVGQFVNAGAPALTFIDETSRWITVDLRENQLANIDVGDAASIVFDAVPGHTFRATVKGIAWGIDPGRTVANGLPQNLSTARWFEPARYIPVQLELAEGVDWPRNVRVGSKAGALVLSSEGNPVGWLAGAMQRLQSMISILF